MDSERVNGRSAIQRIYSFVNTEVANVLDSAGLFSAILGMANISRLGEDGDLLSLDPDAGECVGPGSTRIRLDTRLIEENLILVIDWGRFWSPVAGGSTPELVPVAEKLVRLLEEACVGTLSRIFGEASGVFGREHVYMKRYLDEWNRIFGASRATNLRLTLSLANLGALTCMFILIFELALETRDRAKRSY